MSDRLAKLRAMLDADPSDAFVLYGIAQEHAKLGDHDAALPFYDRCLAADPGYFYAYFHKAQSLIALSREAEALDTARAGLAAARAAGDGKAAGELAGLVDSLEP